VLAYASFADGFSTENFFSTNQSDQGHPHHSKVKLRLTKFRDNLPSWGNKFYPGTMSNMSDEDIRRAMEFGRLKLGRIGDQLHALVMLGGKKVILWVNWPVTQ
jgi:hypothetical protein